MNYDTESAECIHDMCSSCRYEDCACDCHVNADGIFETNRIYRGNQILLQKDGADKDWYISVTGKNGCYRYDGYWRDSADQDEKAALTEAKRGACI